LNEYYDRHGVYPVPIAYDSEGEIVGGWRYSLLPHMIALNEAQLSMLENAKWTPDIDVPHYMYAFPDSDEAFSVNTIILGVVNDGRFVCGGPDDPNAILLTTSGDSGIGWGAVGDVEVDDAGEIVKNAPKPLRGECYAVSFSSGVCVVLKKSVPKELLRQFFVSDAESNPLETLKPYLLFVKSYE
ncbi:MAG: hypothetical protein J6X44_01230, partial [Thermoguttaceae bacterium]|nr:hypothetical protein [Thermoguttaceae bacterium]